MASQENESDTITQPQMEGQETDHSTSDGRSRKMNQSGDESSYNLRRSDHETDHPTLDGRSGE